MLKVSITLKQGEVKRYENTLCIGASEGNITTLYLSDSKVINIENSDISRIVIRIVNAD